MSKSTPAATWADFAQQFGDAVTRAREARGLSQDQMIGLTGLSRQTYQRVERGALPASNVANPTFRTLLAIACALEVELGELIPPVDCKMIHAEAASSGKRAVRPRGEGRSMDGRGASAGGTGSAFRDSANVRSYRPPSSGGASEVSRSESGPWHEKSGVRFPM